MKRFANNRGSALIIALFLMGMLSLIAMMSVNTSNTDMELSFNKENAGKAFYIAEAGANRAISEINNNPGWNTGFDDVAFGGGSFSVNVVDSTTNGALSDTIILTSIAETYAARSSIECIIAPKEIRPFRYAMFGGDTVDIRNGMSTDSYRSDSGSYLTTRLDDEGDAGSNGFVLIDNGAIIGGSVMTSSDTGLFVHEGAIVTGDTVSGIPPQDPGEIPQSEFDSVAVLNDNATGIVGSYTYNDNTGAFSSAGDVVLTGGTYYFSSFILKNAASLTVAPGASATIYVTGNIEIKNSGTINEGGTPLDLLFYSQGDMVLKNSSEMRAVFFNPDGVADLRNSADIYGAVIAGSVIAHNSAGFHYDRALGDVVSKSENEYIVVAWRELF